jgi:hypothetical protein
MEVKIELSHIESFNRQIFVLTKENEQLKEKLKYHHENEEKVIEGNLIECGGFTHSNRNHLLIEVWGEINYIGNQYRTGDKIKLSKINE